MWEYAKGLLFFFSFFWSWFLIHSLKQMTKTQIKGHLTFLTGLSQKYAWSSLLKTLKQVFISILSWLLLWLYSANNPHYGVIDAPASRLRRGEMEKLCHLLSNEESCSVSVSQPHICLYAAKWNRFALKTMRPQVWERGNWWAES